MMHGNPDHKGQGPADAGAVKILHDPLYQALPPRFNRSEARAAEQRDDGTLATSCRMPRYSTRTYEGVRLSV